MIAKIFPALFISFLFASCTSTLSEPTIITLNQSKLEECFTAACPNVDVEYITYDGKPKKVQAINDSINNYIISVLNLGDPAAEAIAKNPEEAIHYFIEDYWRDTSEFPDINEYEAEVLVVENFRSKKLLSITLYQYSYTGGAHGFSSVSYINVDAKTGKVLTNEQLIKDKTTLTLLAEKKLRSDYGLMENDAINSTLFWFENDAFYLSNSIGIVNDKLIIHYNPYEIASYADGSFDIELPLIEIAPYLNYALNK